jgi:hypothetical protein
MHLFKESVQFLQKLRDILSPDLQGREEPQDIERGLASHQESAFEEPAMRQDGQ